jgi:hypothetical protein
MAKTDARTPTVETPQAPLIAKADEYNELVARYGRPVGGPDGRTRLVRRPSCGGLDPC